MNSECAALESQIKKQIPYAAALNFHIESFDKGELIVAAPFESNLNDKTTAFAGSLATLATLSGWSLVTLLVNEQYPGNSIAAVKTEMEYLKPICGDFFAVATASDSDKETLFTLLDEKGRGKIPLKVDLYETGDEQIKASFAGIYHASIGNTKNK